MEPMDSPLKKGIPQEKPLFENCIELDINIENSMLHVSLPNSIKIILPIATAARNSDYINCFYEAVANKSMKFVSKNKISLYEVGWTFIDPIQISMFFYWLGASTLSSSQLGDVSILMFFILSDYFQISEAKRNELISMLSTFNLNNAYSIMKPFLTRRYIPWYLFKEILKAEMKSNTIKVLTIESVKKNQSNPGPKNQPSPGYGIHSNNPFSPQLNPVPLFANSNSQNLNFIPQAPAQPISTLKIESLRLICLKILLDWYDEKNMKIDENFPIPCYNEVNEFIRENKAKLIPNDGSIVNILSQYTSVHRVIDVRLYFEVLNNTVY